MTVVALLSVRGAPGVTTTALALGAVWPDDRDVRLVEADPSGGVLAIRYDIAASGGLAALAAASRRASQPGIIAEYTQPLPGGLPVVAAPVSGEHTAASLMALAGRLPAMLARDQGDTLVDCGRFTPSSPARVIVETADVAVVVARPDAEGLASAHLMCRWLEGLPSHVRVVMIGDRPYPPIEVRAVLRHSVAVLADDARSAAALACELPWRWLRRSPLIRSARTLAADLATTGPPAYDRAERAGLEVDA